MDIDHIRSQWQAGEVEFTDEAERRTAERGVSIANIGEALSAAY